MVDFNPNAAEPKGFPQLDKDYWKSQKKTENTEQNIFDDIIKTNFDVGNLGNSVFNSKKK